MVIYSLLSDTVLSIKKENLKKKKKNPTIQYYIVVFENVSIAYCLCYLPKKKKKKINVVNVMASRFYI